MIRLIRQKVTIRLNSQKATIGLDHDSSNQRKSHDSSKMITYKCHVPVVIDILRKYVQVSRTSMWGIHILKTRENTVR